MASQPIDQYFTIGPRGGANDLDSSFHGQLPLDSAQTIPNLILTNPSFIMDKRIGLNPAFYSNASVGLVGTTTTVTVEGGGGGSTGPRWE